jgi:hypothetical protein
MVDFEVHGALGLRGNAELTVELTVELTDEVPVKLMVFTILTDSAALFGRLKVAQGHVGDCATALLPGFA